MENHLACGAVAVEDGAKALGIVAVLGGYLGGDALQFAAEGVVLGGEVIEGGDVALGDDQHMQGGLGVDVFEGQNLVVFVEGFGGYLLGYHLAKEAVAAHRFLQLYIL